MYGLDINFLKDREIRPVETTAARPAAASGDRRPLYYGLAVAVAALALVGGYWLYLLQQIQRLEAREEELDAEIAEIQEQLDEIDTIRAQTELVEAENRAFAAVFDEIRPWSAFLKELRDRTPSRIQMTAVQQTAGTVIPGDAPAGEDEDDVPPPPSGGVDITGVACSFNDINDFVLTLQRSPLLDGRSVAISQAEKRTELLNPQEEGTCPDSPPDTPDFLVDFTIQGNLSDVPASDLLEVLDRQGAVGLATRIRALRDSGVIETP
ncbi:MAG: PilN domain-containing protein [Leptolyngbya sp. SIO1E4]|nr:PilN domain-containing protein [Leptolyngbya sp. SIO1E4]